MVTKLQQTAEALLHGSTENGDAVIVAVVGAGHVGGMHEKLMSDEADKSPEQTLPGLIETKKRILSNEDLSSLVTDIVQFDYSCIL